MVRGIAQAKYGYDASAIAGSINRGINSGLLMGVDHVEPKDINVKQGSKAVGVYYKALPGDKSSPSWDLPIDGNILNIFFLKENKMYNPQTISPLPGTVTFRIKRIFNHPQPHI